MEITHDLGTLSTSKNVTENIGFLLTNKKGSYCSFFNLPTSRYQGLFYFDATPMKMYKFIDSIGFVGDDNISSLKNGFYFVERKKDDIVESFVMPQFFNSLIYELNINKEIELFLDCKESYDNREWGRHYDIFEEKECTVVRFTKKTDRKEDLSDGIREFALYLAIKSNDSLYEKNDKWIERHYSYDEERNSPPFKRYVYNALRLKGSKFVFSMSMNKDDAIKECRYIFNNINQIKNKEKKYFYDFLKNSAIKKIINNKKINDEIKIAYINALVSLDNLIIADKNMWNVSERVRNELTRSHVTGIFAGLPWFFQFWTRDTLVSLKALLKIDSSLVKKILLQYLDSINNDGRLQTLTGKNLKNFFHLPSADAHGWLFFRCNEFIEKLTFIEKSPKGDFSTKVGTALEKSICKLLKYHTKDNFEINNKLETWMDTAFEEDSREGARIEIQALRLDMYKLMFDLTKDKKYKILENTLKIKVRQQFFNGKIVADGIDDFTIRPNLFIAAYVYPKFLSNDEWEICFDNALQNLSLDWGGLSTIDINSKLFTDISTGQNPKSYHRGDSWFWINNLAASVLSRINKNKFDICIKKIIKASTEEILWRGCIGCHSELSSAKKLESKGCFNQAWSNAMFIEMVDDVFLI